MNRKNINNAYAQEQLLKQYQSEATDFKSKKTIEKQDRINQERSDMERLQRELDEEKKIKLQSKADLMNSQKAEYEKYLNGKNVKMREKSLNYHRKDSEPQGTFKIGGENREIKRKNYHDETENMNLNPTRKENNQNFNNQINHNYYAQQRENAAINMLRNRSQGFNIINHEVRTKNQERNIGRQTENMTHQDTQVMNNNHNNLENYELEKYGYGDNYERIPVNIKHNEENEKNAQEPEVNEYALIYKEYLKKMQNEQQGLKEVTNVNQSENQHVCPFL